MHLKRYHDVEVSNSGVWRIPKRLDLNRLPAAQRYKRHDRKWRRYEKPMPGHAVQVDVKFIAPLAASSRKRYYQFTAIDDCTRLRVLRIYDRLNQKTAIQVADFLDKFPFQVEVIQTDNGSEFRTAFHWHLADRGIRHVCIKPSTPRLNGKVERSHRMDGQEFYRQLKGVVIDDASCSTTSSPGVKPSTTTIGPTAPSAARPPANASSRRPQERPRINDQHQLHTDTGCMGSENVPACYRSEVVTATLS